MPANGESDRTQSDFRKEYANKEALFDGERGLPRYNKSIVKRFAKYFGLVPKDKVHNNLIHEFGAGSGSLAEIFENYYGVKTICIEIDPSLVSHLRSKKFTVYDNLDDLPHLVSDLYTSNVLEHIEDDVEVLRSIRSKMLPNAKIAIYVPAFPFLYSSLDHNAGHFRRYTKKELILKVVSAGFKVEKCYYSDSLGVPASIALKVFGYRNRLNLGSGKSLIIYDRVLFPISQILDAIGFKFFFGKNLYIFARNSKD